MQARSAVQCRSARLSEAVSPAKSARVAIGLIVVKSVAKSLLILINRGDMGLRTPYTKNGSSARQSWGARAPRALAIAPSRSRTFEFPFQQFNSPLDEWSPRGRERHRWANREVEMGGST